MADLKITLDEIKELMDKMQQTNLGELKIKDGEFELKLQARNTSQVISAQAPCAPQTTEYTSIAVTTAPPVAQEKEEISGNVVKSPIVGTFYSAAAPDKAPFVTVGSKVKKGDVIFVIESMKLMNEIQSDFDGEVAEIKVENAQGVEYNQPIMIIK